MQHALLLINQVSEAIEVIINYIFFLVFNVDEEGFYTQISLF
jgi:hypothetical protein